LAEGSDSTETAKEVVAAIPPDAFPALMQVAEEYAIEPFDEAAVFDFGLILDGLENLLQTDLSRGGNTT
jgi:hypothetical protein